jgi:hypothetical protein
MVNDDIALIKKLIYITAFSIAMGFIESAVVVYLRAIYYPEGFSFPLKLTTDKLIGVEVFRELATIIMLLSVSVIAGKRAWERFAYFMLCFGIWDIFYYIWLKVILDWPATVLDWDILFLIPIPWIGPVIAPVILSLLMIVFSIIIIYLYHKRSDFRPPFVSKLLVIAGTIIILYTFMHDIDAAFHQAMPEPYLYGLFIVGSLFYIAAFAFSYFKTIKGKTIDS